MPVPEKPYTRKEAYLNAAATGDTSGIPETPYTREEMYLDAIAKNGGGGGGGGGSSSLSGLTDVDISNPTDGQTLVYNATSGKWENGAKNDSATFIVTVDSETWLLSMTWQQIADALSAGKIGVLKNPLSEEGEIFVYIIRGVTTAGEDDEMPYVVVATTSQALYHPIAFAENPNDYPILDM